VNVTLALHGPTQLAIDATPEIDTSWGTKASWLLNVTVRLAPARALICRVVNASPDAVIVAETGPDGAGGGLLGPGGGLLGPGWTTGGAGGAGGGGSGVGGSGVGSGVGGSGVAVGGTGVAVGASVAVAAGVVVDSDRGVELADEALSLSPLQATAKAVRRQAIGTISFFISSRS
jgi:hypothetical protein